MYTIKHWPMSSEGSATHCKHATHRIVLVAEQRFDGDYESFTTRSTVKPPNLTWRIAYAADQGSHCEYDGSLVALRHSQVVIAIAKDTSLHSTQKRSKRTRSTRSQRFRITLFSQIHFLSSHITHTSSSTSRQSGLAVSPVSLGSLADHQVLHMSVNSNHDYVSQSGAEWSAPARLRVELTIGCIGTITVHLRPGTSRRRMRGAWLCDRSCQSGRRASFAPQDTLRRD
jgi:hypothetical protein